MHGKVEEARVLHSLPGRIRVHLPGWSGKGRRQLEKSLRQLEGVFDEKTTPLAVGEILHLVGCVEAELAVALKDAALLQAGEQHQQAALRIFETLEASYLIGLAHLHGKPVRLSSPVDAVRAGIGLVPEDRKHQGAILDMSIRTNTTLARLKPVEKARLKPAGEELVRGPFPPAQAGGRRGAGWKPARRARRVARKSLTNI